MTATALVSSAHAPHCTAPNGEHVERVDGTLVARCTSCGATETRTTPADTRALARILAALDRLVQIHARQLRAAL